MSNYELEVRRGKAIKWPNTTRSDRPLSDARTVLLKAAGDLKLFTTLLVIDGDRCEGIIYRRHHQARHPGDSKRIDCDEPIVFTEANVFEVLEVKSD